LPTGITCDADNLVLMPDVERLEDGSDLLNSGSCKLVVSNYRAQQAAAKERILDPADADVTCAPLP
jgi:hypothetical protein